MAKVLGILTSRWLQAAVVLLWIAALRLHLRWLLFAAAGLAALVVAALLAAVVLGMGRVRNAWKKFPGTPEYAEYAAGRDRKLRENDDKRIETGGGTARREAAGANRAPAGGAQLPSAADHSGTRGRKRAGKGAGNRP